MIKQQFQFSFLQKYPQYLSHSYLFSTARQDKTVPPSLSLPPSLPLNMYMQENIGYYTKKTAMKNSYSFFLDYFFSFLRGVCVKMKIFQ